MQRDAIRFLASSVTCLQTIVNIKRVIAIIRGFQGFPVLIIKMQYTELFFPFAKEKRKNYARVFLVNLVITKSNLYFCNGRKT